MSQWAQLPPEIRDRPEVVHLRLEALEEAIRHRSKSDTTSTTPIFVYQRAAVIVLLLATAFGVIRPEIGIKLILALLGLH